MRILKFTFLFLALLVSGCGVSSSDELYNGFKNPPASARPLARWSWDSNTPTEEEILNRLDALKNEGFGGIEIYPAESLNSRVLKFAADAAKQRGLLVDLALGPIFASPDLQPDERSQMITLAQELLSGPATYATTVNELVELPDETRFVDRPTRRRIMFLRLIPQGLDTFEPGIKPNDKINPDSSITFDIPDGNHTFYVGVLHENYVRPAGSASDVPLLNVLNRQAVEKYLGGIFADLSRAFDGRLGDSIHSISCDDVDFFGTNWTGDFALQFLHRRKYDVLPYLPVVLDDTLPKKRTRFYDTTRRVRYDFCLTFAELFNENFVQPFNDLCQNNGVIPRTGVADVNMFLARKALAEADSMFPDTQGNARLSYLVQNSTPRSQIAILFPTVDIWSDCGLYGSRCRGYIWYLFGLREALNHNGYTADYITEDVIAQSAYEDGRLHFGSQTWDAVIVPDVCSIEAEPARILRLFARAGGKIAFVGGYPGASHGFKDLLQRTIPVEITMERIQKESRDRAVVFLPPQKDGYNLTFWAAQMTEKLGVRPAVALSPPNDNLRFIRYAAGDRDIFLFTNTNRIEQVSSVARFDIAGKTPTVWDPETGARSVFPTGENKGTLAINLRPLESLLLVFEPSSNGGK